MGRVAEMAWATSVGAVALASLGVPGWAADGTGATEARSVVATARAQGVRATYTVPDYVVVSEFFDGGGPVTESVADSTGRATSFSSLPWPGENAVTAPGTLSVAIGQPVPLTYPFHVRADHPTTPTAEVKDPSGTYAISAAAEAGRAVAAGAFEGPVGASRSRAATSAVLDDGGVVRVVAETVDTGLEAGDGVLRIASVRSRSETTLAPGDPRPVTRGELIVEGASVGGQPVTVDADGVHAGDQVVPAPVGRGVSSESDLLGQAGISVRVEPAGAAGGADALVITSKQRVPAPNNPTGELVMRIGGASSEIVVGSPDGPSGASETPTQIGPEPVASPGVPADGPAPVVIAPIRSAAPLPVTGLPVTVTPPDAGDLVSPSFPTSAVPAPGAAVTGPGEAALPAAPASAAYDPVLPDLATTGSLFFLLGMGAVVLVLATRLHRWRQVRWVGGEQTGP